MRPTILTDDVLAEIDLQSDIQDATDREPTDEAMTRDAYREMWPRCESRAWDKTDQAVQRSWQRWVRLP